MKKYREWSAPVASGQARFRVPSAQTVGMSFDVTTADGAGALGASAVPVIALGFAGSPAGTTLSRRQALKRGQQANWCWAGTTRASVTITVSTYSKVTANPEPWETKRGVYFWAHPTVSTFNDAANMHASNAMGHQDAPYCS